MNRGLNWARNVRWSVRQSIGRLAEGRRRWWAAGAIIVPLIAAPLFRILFQRQLLIDKLQRSREQCRRADENLLLAMATFGDRIDHLGLETELLPKEELAFYKAIYDQSLSEPAERFAIAMARKRAGMLHLKLHQLDEARLCFKLSIHMLESLAVEKPQPDLAPMYRRTLAETYADFAEYQSTIGDTAAAESQFDSALALLSKLLEKSPDADDLVADQARVRQARGVMYARLHRYADAEGDFNRALAVRLKRSDAPGKSNLWLGSAGSELTATWLQLSDLYCKTNRPGDAIAVLEQAIGAYAQLGRYKSDPRYRGDCAEAWEKLNEAYLDALQTSPSAPSYGGSIEAIRVLERKYPEIAAFQKPSQRHHDF